MKKKLIELNGEIDKSTAIVRDFHTSLSVTERITGQKISKDIKDLEKTRSHLNLFDIYRKIYPTTAKYTFFQMHMVHSLT